MRDREFGLTRNKARETLACLDGDGTEGRLKQKKKEEMFNGD